MFPSPWMRVAALHLLKLAVLVLDFFSDLLWGWSFSKGTRRERELARSHYERSAQVVVPFATATFVPAWPIHTVNNYAIFKHVKYVSPSIILESDQICLSHLTEKEAFFAVAKPGEDFYDTAKHPFLPIAIHHLSHRFIVLPISSFHRLAEECGDPKVTVGIIAMTLRCGSTLLSQVMNRVPNTRSLSEPFSIDAVSYMFQRGQINREEVRQLMRSAVRLLAKTEPGSKTTRVVFKLDGYTNNSIGILKDLFPKVKFIISTRHPVPSIKSYRKVFLVLGTGVYKMLGLFWRNHVLPMPFPTLEEFLDEKWRLNQWFQNISDDEAAALWYTTCLASLRLYLDAFDITVFYEDLVSDPRRTIARLFKVMEIEEEFVSLGLTALERDSQEGIVANQLKLSVTPQMKETIDQSLRRLRVPLTTESTFEEFKRFIDVDAKS